MWSQGKQCCACTTEQEIILPFLPLKLQVIYCTRGYREDVSNREWNQSCHQLQLWSRAVHWGGLEKESSSSTLLDYMTWLPEKNFLKICALSFYFCSLPRTSKHLLLNRTGIRILETFPFIFCSNPFKEDFLIVQCRMCALTPSGLLFSLSWLLKQMILIICPLITQRSNFHSWVTSLALCIIYNCLY